MWKAHYVVSALISLSQIHIGDLQYNSPLLPFHQNKTKKQTQHDSWWLFSWQNRQSFLHPFTHPFLLFSSLLSSKIVQIDVMDSSCVYLGWEWGIWWSYVLWQGFLQMTIIEYVSECPQKNRKQFWDSERRVFMSSWHKTHLKWNGIVSGDHFRPR